MGAVDLCRAVKQQSFGNRPVGFYADRLFHVLQPHQGSKDAHGCSQFLAGIFDSPGAAVAADLQLSVGSGLSGQAAAQMIEGIKEAHGGEVPEGVIIEITGALVDMYTTDCHTGLMSVLEQYPQLTVAQGEGNWNNDDSYARASDLLNLHGDKVLGIYVHTPDIMGSGVVNAVENANLNPADYFISGICIGKEGIGLLQEGKLYAVVEQPALDAAILAVEYIHDMFEGKALPEIGDTVEQEGALWSPAKVIENTYCDEGRTLLIQAPLIPQECDPADPQLWENRIQ